MDPAGKLRIPCSFPCLQGIRRTLQPHQGRRAICNFARRQYVYFLLEIVRQPKGTVPACRLHHRELRRCADEASWWSGNAPRELSGWACFAGEANRAASKSQTENLCRESQALILARSWDSTFLTRLVGRLPLRRWHLARLGFASTLNNLGG
jgi:hypothetical protein